MTRRAINWEIEDALIRLENPEIYCGTERRPCYDRGAVEDHIHELQDEIAQLRTNNARLIASSTDMLEALQAILPFIPVTSASEGGASAYSENVRAADKVRAAIAKATGADQ